jgi:transposase
MVFSDYTKLRILYWRNKGLNAPSIQSKLSFEGLSGTRRGVDKFLKKYERTGSIGRKEGSGRPSKVNDEVKERETQMQADDETTVTELQKLLTRHHYLLSKSTILRCRQRLG